MIELTISIILIVSIFTKKYLLILLGLSSTIYLVNNKKNYKYFTFFILLNFWLFIAAIKQLFSSHYYGDSENIKYYDFTRIVLIISSIYFSSLFIILRLELIKASKLLFITIIISIIFSYLILFNYSYLSQDFNLYGFIININNGSLFWHWGTVIGLVGVLIPLHYFNIRNSTAISAVLFLLFIVISCYLLQGRSLLLFSIVYLLYIAKYFITKNTFLFISAFLVTVFLFFTIQIIDKLDNNVFNRVLNSFQFDNFQNEGRVALFIDFFNSVNYYNFFGTLDTAALYTNEGLESFHNIFLDSFWYAGYIGLISVIISYFYFFKIIYSTKTFFLKIIGLFILLGLTFGAPPFSDIIALNIFLPFYLYTYFNRENIEIPTKYSI